MFRKRKLPALEAGTIRQLEREDAISTNVTNEETQAPEKDLIAAPKKVKSGTGSGGGILVKEVPTESEENDKEKLEILDGTVVEEELEARKLRNPALVTIEQDKTVQKKPASKFGPSSAPAYVRATTIIDYKPDLCKDYNETGYCGYGDTCIYLHDRTTYVSGNVLDQRWDEMVKKTKSSTPSDGATNDNNSKSTTCGICKEVLSNPAVRTRCGHKFCRSCAFDRFEKSPSCAVCGLQTLGIFNDINM